MRGWDDAAEFHNEGGRWLAENGDAVVIEPADFAANRTPTSWQLQTAMASGADTVC